MAEKTAKPYLKIASTLVIVGAGLLAIERYGLHELSSNGQVHIAPNLMSLLVLVPVGLILAGAVVFVVGRMRRL